MTQIATLIGEAMLAFSNAEFLLDHIFQKVGLTNSKFEFIGNSRTGFKINQYKEKLLKSKIEESERIANLMEEVDSFRQLRNVLAHSIILSNSSKDQEFMTHKFKTTKEGVTRHTEIFTADHLESQIQEFREVCRSLNELLKDIDE